MTYSMAKKKKEPKPRCAAPYDVERQAAAKDRATRNEKPDFWITRLDEIEAAAKEAKIAKVTELLPSAGGRKIYCFEYGIDIEADYKSATQEMVEEFHSRGLKVGLWTANNLWALNYCRYLDVDFIESDIYGG